MKYKDKNDIGEFAQCILAKDVVEILKVMSKDTWIKRLPKMFIDLLNDNYEASLKSIKYVPNIYFYLNNKFKNDNLIIKATIKSFKRKNRMDEINIRYKPLKKRICNNDGQSIK